MIQILNEIFRNLLQIILKFACILLLKIIKGNYTTEPDSERERDQSTVKKKTKYKSL